MKGKWVCLPEERCQRCGSVGERVRLLGESTLRHDKVKCGPLEWESSWCVDHWWQCAGGLLCLALYHWSAATVVVGDGEREREREGKGDRGKGEREREYCWQPRASAVCLKLRRLDLLSFTTTTTITINSSCRRSTTVAFHYYRLVGFWQSFLRILISHLGAWTL